MTEKKLDDARHEVLILVDLGIKYRSEDTIGQAFRRARETGLSPEFVALALQERQRKPPAVVGGEVAAAALPPPRDYREWRARKAGLSLVAVGPDGRPLNPDKTPVSPQWTKELGNLVHSDNLFQRRLASGAIPSEEVQAANAGGITTWRRLRKKYGDPNQDMPDRRFGFEDGGAA